MLIKCYLIVDIHIQCITYTYVKYIQQNHPFSVFTTISTISNWISYFFNVHNHLRNVNQGTSSVIHLQSHPLEINTIQNPLPPSLAEYTNRAWKEKIKTKIFLAKVLEGHGHWEIPFTLCSTSSFYDYS